ncbi:hypothetical protein H0H93_008758 [Arthromyces matolae]|nr:hypothetical protein H0H93_008758 [Arthromyces matolae]
MPTDGIRDSGNLRSTVSKKGMASKGRKRSKKGHPEKPTVVTQEVLQAEREDLISQKRQQLHTVVDRHDTLVREMFHMDHFKMMVKYDPAIAKTDNTKVFQNYKSSLYSLVDEPVAGPSRTTRRTRTEQQQLAQSVSISAPLPTPPSRASPAKKQLKAKTPISTKLVSLDTAKSHAQKPKAPQFSVFDDEPLVDQPLPSILVRRSSRKQEEEESISHPRKKQLARLLREKKAGGHRVLIFTQMTRILDILEIFLNFHGYLYLRLDGATKIEDRQYITERFNADPRVFCFIASSRSGGVGINLTGADTVVFYDSDFNPQMDKQCEDRAHRIGQIRDVHIYRFVSQHTVEEALLRKANQKRSLDDLVIQKGEFDWRSLFNDQSALSKALEEFEDTEDVHAAAVAATEEVALQGADEADFGGEIVETSTSQDIGTVSAVVDSADSAPNEVFDMEEYEGEGGTTVDYMISFVDRELEFFKDWRL